MCTITLDEKSVRMVEMLLVLLTCFGLTTLGKAAKVPSDLSTVVAVAQGIKSTDPNLSN